MRRLGSAPERPTDLTQIGVSPDTEGTGAGTVHGEEGLHEGPYNSGHPEQGLSRGRVLRTKI